MSNRILVLKNENPHNWHVASWPSSFPPSHFCKFLSLIGYKVCVGDMEFIRDEYATQA